MVSECIPLTMLQTGLLSIRISDLSGHYRVFFTIKYLIEACLHSESKKIILKLITSSFLDFQVEVIFQSI